MAQKDHTHRSWGAILILILILICVSFIPPQTIGEVSLRRANILSDIISFDDSSTKEVVAMDEDGFESDIDIIDDSSFESDLLEESGGDDHILAIDIEDVEDKIIADTIPEAVETTYTWRVDIDSTKVLKYIIDSITLGGVPATAIDEFSSEVSDSSRMAKLYNALLDGRQHTRIAVLGDSFVEADIITADLRELLQGRFGGCGIGFTPMSSPLTKYRRTIKTQSKGWSSYNIMQYKNTPKHLQDDFYISGWVCQAKQDAQTRWEMTDAREHLESAKIARIFFISKEDSRVEVILNDSIHREFTISGASSLRQIEIFSSNIESLTFKVLSGEHKFVGYGAIFEGSGVTVDNYSIRSNNGHALFRTNPSINAQFDKLLNYDLVILQYGLNIMESGRFNYNSYSRQIENVVAYINSCFPTADVLIMGVSDRSVKGGNGFVTMDAIPHMLRYQSRAAKNSGASFWSTYSAMNSIGGMSEFVKNGWAAKDYTHINYAGGREIAKVLFSAIDHGTAQVAAKRRRAERLNAKSKNIISKSQKRSVKKEFLSEPTLTDKR